MTSEIIEGELLEDIEPDAVRSYLVDFVKLEEDKREITDDMGRMKADFVDGTGVNKTALSFVQRLHKFTPEVRADVLRSLDLLTNAMGPVWSQQETAELDL